MSRKRARVVRRGGGIGGKIVALLLGFILGIVGTVGGIIGGGYFLVSSVTVKDAVTGIESATGTEIDYSQYITEEYAEKTVLGIIGSIGEVATEFSNGTGSLTTLERISPYVRTMVEQLTASTAEFGVPIDSNALMTTPFSQLSDFVTQTLNGVELGKVLETVGFETSILKLLCYGEEGVHYTVENDQIVMLGSNKPLTIGALMNDDGISGVLNSISLAGLIDSLGTVDASDSIMRALLYGTEGIDYELVDGKVEMKPIYFLYNSDNDYFIDDTNSVYLKTPDGYQNDKGVTIQANTLQLTSSGDEQTNYDYSVYDTNGTLLYELKTPVGESDGYFAAYSNGVEQNHRGITMGDLMGGKDLTTIFENLSVGSLIVPDPSNTSTIQLALAYGQKDLHYTVLPDNTIKMLPMQIAVFAGEAYDASGENLDATVNANANGYEVKINGGKTYYLSANSYPKDESNNQKTLQVGESQVPLFYAAIDTSGTMEYYSARTIGSFLSGDIIGDLLSSITISDIMGGEITEDDGFLYAIKDWKLDSFMDLSTINTLKLSDLISISDSAPAALQAIKDWTIGDLQDGNKFNELTIGDLVEVTESSPAILKTIASWTIADLTSSDKFNTLKIEDLVEVTESSPEILKTLADWTIEELTSSDKFNTLKIEDLVEVTESSPEILKTIADWTIADLSSSDKFDSLTVGDLIGEQENPPKILEAISSWTIADLQNPDNFNTLKLEQLVTVDASSPAILQAISSWTIADMQNSDKFNALKLEQLVTVDASSPAILKAIGTWTIAELQDPNKFNTLKLNEIIAVEESSPAILKAIGDWTIEELQDPDMFNSLKLNEIITVEEDSPAILKTIAAWTIEELQTPNKFDSLKLNEIMTVDENSPAILNAIGGWTIADMQNQDKFDQLYLKDLMTIDTTSASTPAILKAISEWQLKDMKDQTKFDNLTLVQVIGEEAVAQSEYFRTIGDTPISGLSTAIDNLSINVMFEDTIYRKMELGGESYFAYSVLDANGHPIKDAHGNHTLLPLYEKNGKYYTDEACTNEKPREFNGVWHYLLQDPADPEGEVKQYTFHDIDLMISNMTQNIQHATLNQLVADDVVDLGSSSIANNEIKTEITMELSFGMLSQTIRVPIGNGGTDEHGNKLGKTYTYSNGVAKQTMGELTINEMIDYLSNIFVAITELENQTAIS